MNLKERGITVGDLLIILIIITTIIFVKSLNKEKKTSLNLGDQKSTLYMTNSLLNKYPRLFIFVM